jgi:hypothetical protein
MDKELRLFAAEAVIVSELSKQAKHQLLNFIQNEATDAQVKALVLDGRIVKLDEQAEEIVNERFAILEFDPVTAWLGMTVAAFGATGLLMAKNIYKTYMSKAGRACAGRSGEDRQRCISKFKAKAKLEALKKLLARCDQTKNPEKCKAKLSKKIARMEKTMD